MARKKKPRSFWQWLKEEPVFAVRIVGSGVSIVVTEFALPISEPMQDFIVTIILLYLAGPGAVEIWLARRNVTPDAKTERLAEEGPQLNPDVEKALGRAPRGRR
jgi:hypothetical protein